MKSLCDFKKLFLKLTNPNPIFFLVVTFFNPRPSHKTLSSKHQQISLVNEPNSKKSKIKTQSSCFSHLNL